MEGVTCAGAGPEGSPEGFREDVRPGWGSRGSEPAEVAGQAPGLGRARYSEGCRLRQPVSSAFRLCAVTTFALTWRVEQGAAATKAANPGLDGEIEGM